MPQTAHDPRRWHVKIGIVPWNVERAMEHYTDRDLANILTGLGPIEERAAAQREYVERLAGDLTQPLADCLVRYDRGETVRECDRPLIRHLATAHALPLVRFVAHWAETTTVGHKVAEILIEQDDPAVHS